jgi:hypothetical protein
MIFFIFEMTRDCYWRIKRVGDACVNTDRSQLLGKIKLFYYGVRYLLVVCFVIRIHIIIMFVCNNCNLEQISDIKFNNLILIKLSNLGKTKIFFT